jgi:hypothetical protein
MQSYSIFTQNKSISGVAIVANLPLDGKVGGNQLKHPIGTKDKRGSELRNGKIVIA